ATRPRPAARLGATSAAGRLYWPASVPVETLDATPTAGGLRPAVRTPRLAGDRLLRRLRDNTRVSFARRLAARVASGRAGGAGPGAGGGDGDPGHRLRRDQPAAGDGGPAESR